MRRKEVGLDDEGGGRQSVDQRRRDGLSRGSGHEERQQHGTLKPTYAAHSITRAAVIVFFFIGTRGSSME